MKPQHFFKKKSLRKQSLHFRIPNHDSRLRVMCQFGEHVGFWGCYAISRAFLDLQDLVIPLRDPLDQVFCIFTLALNGGGGRRSGRMRREKRASWLWAWEESATSCIARNLILSFFQPNCKWFASWALLSLHEHSGRWTTERTTREKIWNQGSSMGTDAKTGRVRQPPNLCLVRNRAPRCLVTEMYGLFLSSWQDCCSFAAARSLSFCENSRELGATKAPLCLINAQDTAPGFCQSLISRLSIVLSQGANIQYSSPLCNLSYKGINKFRNCQEGCKWR